MPEIKNEEENLDLPEVKEGEEDTTDWKSEATKLREKAIAQRERTKNLKQELKELQEFKAQHEKPTPDKKENKPEESALLQKLERLSLRTAGIEHPDDVELARTTAKKWNMDIDVVLSDEDFKVKLEKQQTARNNAIATSGIRGGQGTSQAKNTPEYWQAKGNPPTAQDVPDRKTRAKIVRSMMKNARTSGKTFYND